MNLVVVQYPVH